MAKLIGSAACRRGRDRRKGSVAVLAALLLVIFLACLAFSIDLGYLCLARSQAQRAADAAALAGVWRLLDDARLSSSAGLGAVDSAARDAAVRYAAKNQVCGAAPALDANSGNDPNGDVVLGRYDFLTSEWSTLVDPSQYNGVLVRVRRSAGSGGPVRLFFARVLGQSSAVVSAEAMAGFQDSISGFRPCPGSSLIPLAVSYNAWKNMAGPDNWAWDPVTRSVTAGADGLKELMIFPDKSNSGGIVPGNFGTLHVGTATGTSDLCRQILEGLSAADLAPYGGVLNLDPQTGTLALGGDTGASHPILFSADEILGKPVTIAIYSQVQGTGSNAIYTIVGFVGVRVVNVVTSGGTTTGIYIQPAMVIDNNAIYGTSISSGVYRTPSLTR